MNRKFMLIQRFLLIFIATSFFIGCGSASADSPKPADKQNASSQKADDKKESQAPRKKRDSVQQFLLPQASGAAVQGSEVTSIDYSNTSEGYVMVQYMGQADMAKLQITVPEGTKYTYTLVSDTYETFPLPGGDGAYHLDVLEHAYDDMYAMAFSLDLDVKLADEFKPFLYPNQYAWYTQESKAAKYGIELSDKSYDDLSFVENVYHYVIKNITYDTELAENIKPNYIPNIDRTMETGKGICFDYAALMASILRSQGVPTKLEVGYSGEAYHAWISVYLKESGWVDNIIEFNGKNWSLMDPTLAANNSQNAVGKYIGDGSNYTVKYSY